MKKNISYNLPGSLYYKYQNLPKELFNSLVVTVANYGSDKQNIEGIANTIKSKLTGDCESWTKVFA